MNQPHSFPARKANRAMSAVSDGGSTPPVTTSVTETVAENVTETAGRVARPQPAPEGKPSRSLFSPPLQRHRYSSATGVLVHSSESARTMEAIRTASMVSRCSTRLSSAEVRRRPDAALCQDVDRAIGAFPSRPADFFLPFLSYLSGHIKI